MVSLFIYLQVLRLDSYFWLTSADVYPSEEFPNLSPNLSFLGSVTHSFTTQPEAGKVGTKVGSRREMQLRQGESNSLFPPAQQAAGYPAFEHFRCPAKGTSTWGSESISRASARRVGTAARQETRCREELLRENSQPRTSSNKQRQQWGEAWGAGDGEKN